MINVRSPSTSLREGSRNLNFRRRNIARY